MERLLLKHLQNEEEDYLYSLVWQDLLLYHLVWKSSLMYCPSVQEKNFYFSYTGQYQEFTAPMNGKYKIELWGASGAYNGGLGGYTKGEIYLDASDKLYIYVGGVGKQGAAAEGGGMGYQ